MSEPPSPQSISPIPLGLMDFLRSTKPFGDLEETALEGMARRLKVSFYAKGEPIIQWNGDLGALYIVQKGAVKIVRLGTNSDEQITTLAGEGFCFGALTLMQDKTPAFSVEAVEDVFCLELEKSMFLELMAQSSILTRYFLNPFSEETISAVYREIRYERIRSHAHGASSLFRRAARDLIRAPAQWIGRIATIRQAAQAMTKHDVDALLVKDSAGRLVGIVSDSDMRDKVVAAGLDAATPVEAVMNSTFQVAGPDSAGFELLLRMMSDEISHVAIEEGGSVQGVVNIRDILAAQGVSPMIFIQEIVNRSMECDIESITKKAASLIVSLIESGAGAADLARIMTIVGDNVLQRMTVSVLPKLGPPPGVFCRLALGAEGRAEQIFPAPGRYALIYEDPPQPAQEEKTLDYFADLQEATLGHIIGCDPFPHIRSTRPSELEWPRPVSQWPDFIDNRFSPAFSDPRTIAALVDMRPVYGDMGLADPLRRHIMRSPTWRAAALPALVKDCLRRRPPVSFFRDAALEWSGALQPELDLERRGVEPIVGFARLFALQHGIEETNTLARLDRLWEMNIIDTELRRDLTVAYEFQRQLITALQLRAIEEGSEQGAVVTADALSDLEKRTLKEIFRVIRQAGALVEKINTNA